MRITLIVRRLTDGKLSQAHRMIFHSAEAAADACRGVSADQVRLKVRFDRPSDFADLAKHLPVMRETMANSVVANRV